MNNNNLFLLVLLMITLTAGCSRQEADLILFNASLYRADNSFLSNGALAIREGRVAATGPADALLSAFKARETVDLQGKYLYPGFIDAHAHFYGYGMKLLQYADLSETGSPEEVYERLRLHQQAQGGEWLLGRGWDQNDWPDKQFPDKSALDTLFSGIAVYLVRVDGHAAWCNSKSLELAGIHAGTRVEGGTVLLKNGEPSGILIDNAMDRVSALIPPPARDLQVRALLAAQEKCFRAGLTSVTDCGLPADIILLMDSLQKQGLLKIRINAMINPVQEEMDYFTGKGKITSDRLRVGTIKLYADGALGSRGALLLDPYTDDPQNRGLQIAPRGFYDSICSWALANNFQVATHAIGDSANRLMLRIYGRHLGQPNDKRWRIEHAQIVHPDDFQLFGKYSIVPSIQSTHATSDMDWAEKRIGPERIRGAYAAKQLLRQNGWIPNGTDFPIEKIDPLHTYYAAVFRTNHQGEPEGGFLGDEALSREEALLSVTLWAAKASFEENQKGSLEPGKWADFVLLDTDLLSATPGEVLSARIESTWVAGEKVY